MNRTVFYQRGSKYDSNVRFEFAVHNTQTPLEKLKARYTLDTYFY